MSDSDVLLKIQHVQDVLAAHAREDEILHAAEEKARILASDTLEKRLYYLNQLREGVITKDAYDNAHQSLINKVDSNREKHEIELSNVHAKINTLELARSSFKGSYAALAFVGGLLLTIIGWLFHYYR